VKFQVEKNLKAAPHQLLQQRRAGRGEQFLADLQAA